MTNVSDAPLESRTTPVQQRGQARVDALLDAAAEIVAESGIAALTTSAIAERSGSSVGAVYRYFPNADAVLIALAERNLDLFATRVAAVVETALPADWRAFTSACIDVYADLATTVAAFRVIRFGDVVAVRFTNRESGNNEVIGRALDQYLVEHYGFAETDELLFRTQIALECADAVTRRAFLTDRGGEERFIDAAKQLVRCVLAPLAPDVTVEELASSIEL